MQLCSMKGRRWSTNGAAGREPGRAVMINRPKSLLRLRSGGRGVCRQTTELRHKLDIGIEIGEHDHLPNLRVLVSAAAGGCETATPACAAACAPADVLLAGIALGHRHVFGRPGVDQVKRDRRLALLDVDTAGERTNRAAPAAEVAEQAADRRASTAAAR